MTDLLLLDLPESVETSRLMIRTPRSGDGDALFEAVTESLPELRRFLASLPWVATPPTHESSEIFCRNGRANFLARKDLPFLVFERGSGRLLASTGLHRTVWQTPKTEVGYWCRTSATGNGYITEAVAALTDYAFKHVKAVRVEINVDEANIPSRAVAERAGFALEAVLRNECRDPDGTLRNTCVYAKLPP